MNTGTNKKERTRQKHVLCEEVKAEHLRNNVVYWGIIFFAVWGMVSATITSIEAICRALGVV